MKRLLLVGAGHAHQLPLARAREFLDAGIAVTLIAPGRFWYSGMGPGMVSRFYEPRDDTVDVQTLVERNGGSFIRDRVARIDAAAREVHLQNGDRIRYDGLSLNIGSEVPLGLLPGAAEFGIAVKPIKNLFALRESLVAQMKPEPLRVVVLGGGAAGVEVCLNISQLLEQLRRRQSIALIASEERLLTDASSKASRILARCLHEHGVDVLFATRARQATNGEVIFENEARLPFDLLVVAIGIRAPALLREAGFSCAKDGSMHVNEFLQNPAHPEIFGAGDCVCFGENCLPRIGVYAVRQAPILFRNLVAYLTNKPLVRFHPQKRYLLILNLGDGSALLTRGNLALRSRWAFWLKNWIDRRFVTRFRQDAK